MSKALRNKLDESGIPYQIAGEGSPFQKPEIAAIITCLQYLAGTNELPKGILRLSASQVKTLLEPLTHSQHNLKVSKLAGHIAKLLQFDMNQARLQQFLGSTVRFDNQSLETYLAHIQAIAEQEFYDPLADAVTLFTIHAAKGLEFPHVFLIGAEDNILPYLRAHGDTNLNEERRLFYVAVTRARDRLDILHAKKRAGKPATLSSFVTDIPASLLPRRTDPNMATQQERLRKRAVKRSQTTLF